MTFAKDPASRLDYQFDWSAWLSPGETITGHTVTTGAGLVVDSSSTTETTVTAWIAGGTVDTDYLVTCQIVTSAGRTDERTLPLRVQQR